MLHNDPARTDPARNDANETIKKLTLLVRVQD